MGCLTAVVDNDVSGSGPCGVAVVCRFGWLLPQLPTRRTPRPVGSADIPAERGCHREGADGSAGPEHFSSTVDQYPSVPERSPGCLRGDENDSVVGAVLDVEQPA